MPIIHNLSDIFYLFHELSQLDSVYISIQSSFSKYYTMVAKNSIDKNL